MPDNIISSSDLQKYDNVKFVGHSEMYTETYECTRHPKASWEICITQTNNINSKNRITNSKGILNFINGKMRKWFISGTLTLSSKNKDVNPMEYKF